MKKNKIILLLVIITFLLIPNLVFAKTEEEANAILDSLIISEDNETPVLGVKTINPKIIQDKVCSLTKEDFLERYPGNASMPIDELEQLVKDYNSSCRTNVIFSLIEGYSRSIGNENWSFHLDEYDDTNSMATLLSFYDGGYVEKKCKINYITENKNIYEKANAVLDKFDDNYINYSLNTFNSIYHYGPIFQNNRIDSEMILYKFPRFKNILMDNPEFDYEIAWDGGGGMPTETGCAGYVLIYKNDVVYGMQYVNFVLDNRLYVDKNAEGTVFEKAEARLNEFFNNSVDLEIDVENAEYLDDEYFKGYFTTITIGKYDSPIFIEEVDAKDLDKFEVEAYHKETGVKVNSNSYEVPIDATVNAKDVKEKTKEVFDKNKFKLHGVYDIDVVKTGNGEFVRVIENGIDVYIPIMGHKLGDKLKVYHIKDDNKKGDEYEGEVVDVDGRHYVKFRTTHFSTYAVVEEISNINNPNTGDGIISTIIICVVATLGLIIIYKYRPRKNK